MPAAPLLHAGRPVTWDGWSFEPTVVAGAVIVCGFYVWALSTTHTRLDARRAVFFYAGVLTMFASLASPLDAAAHHLLSFHMLQHVVLATIGPPLVLLGLPPGMLRPLLGPGALGRAARVLTNPVLTGTLFLLNMWLWHVPPVYEAALDHLGVHIAMHVAFMTTGLLYWWPVIDPLPELSRMSDGARMLYIFASGMPMALLALLLLASSSVVYGFYDQPPYLWGIEPLADQQVAGLIMGALGEAAGFVAISLLFFRYLGREETLQPAVPPRDAPPASRPAGPR
jgi:cytochrome c oxidase assembly factor CtaG